MSWLDRLRRRPVATTPPKTEIDIPLFPFGGVLLPGARMSLKVFEQRYLDMAAECMREKTPFGVCLIEHGQEVGTPAVPHAIGTLAQIDQGDVPQLGILMLAVHGTRRFRIIEQHAQADGLLRARVELLDDINAQPIPEALRALLPLLEKIVNDLGPTRMPPPYAYDDAGWVGYRLTEIAPVQPLAKQKLLELDDPIARLEILHAYFAQRKLV